MSPILNWYKLVSERGAGQAHSIIGRVLLIGGRNVKSGSSVELRGLRYPDSPEVQKFELYRRQFADHGLYDKVDEIPAQFGTVTGFGHSAWSPPISLRNKHSRVVNRTFYFQDDQGHHSAEISTSRFGHIEVTQIDLTLTGGAAGTVPHGSARFHVLAKPMKDPLLEFSLLIPGGRRPSGRIPFRGYRDLDEMVLAGVEGGRDDRTQAVASAILQTFEGVESYFEPPLVEVGEGRTGETELVVNLNGPGTLNFAVQAVASVDATNWLAPELDEDPEDPLDDDLKGVMISRIVSITLFPNGQFFVA